MLGGLNVAVRVRQISNSNYDLNLIDRSKPGVAREVRRSEISTKF